MEGNCHHNISYEKYLFSIRKILKAKPDFIITATENYNMLRVFFGREGCKSDFSNSVSKGEFDNLMEEG